MADPLHSDLRKRAVQTYLNGEGTVKQIAARFLIAPSTLSKYLKVYRETGSLEPKPHSGGRSRQKIFEEHAQALQNYLLKRNDLTNPELADLLLKDFNITIDPSQISRVILKYGITRKKNSI